MVWNASWRPAAERDLTQYAGHIAEDSLDAALRFIDAVEETAAALCDNPMIGIETEFSHPELAGLRRTLVRPPFDKYLIFYRAQTTSSSIELVRIIHGARDLPHRLLE